MCREHDAQAGCRQLPHLIQHENLVAEVQACGRFIHHDQPGILGQRPGDQDQLPLAPGNPRVIATGKLIDPHLRECRASAIPVLARGPGEGATVSGAAHQDHVTHRVREHGRVRLRDVGHHAGDVPAVKREDVAIVEHDAARLARNQPEQGLEERGLAAPVGSQQTQNLAGLQREVHRTPHRKPRIAEPQPFGPQHAHQLRRPVASSQRNTGAPTKAVRIPSGVSVSAMVRAIVSTASR